ncbi:MAG: hypothetical protein J7484_08705 [Microbacterium sp.]|nr:hypothetical protein [Microbacterium sp.]
MLEGQEGPALEPDAPAGVRRRDTRAESSTGLPSAGAVARVHATVSGWSRGRKLLALGSAVGGIGLIVFGALTSGAAGQTAVADGPVTTYADKATPQGGTIPVGEHLAVDRESDDAASADQRRDERKDAAKKDAADAESTTPSGSTPGAAPGAGTPGTGSPGTGTPGTGTPGTENPGTGAPGTGTPGTGTPGTGTPGTGTPGTGTPGTGTPGTGNPGTGTPTDPGPSTPPAPKPLGWGTLTKVFAVDALGIKVLGSYTLTLSGNPGSKATVTYGGSTVGTVTFDANGFASKSIGALLDLGLTNPKIRVSYSDGTAGSAIEALRDSLSS